MLNKPSQNLVLNRKSADSSVNTKRLVFRNPNQPPEQLPELPTQFAAHSKIPSTLADDIKEKAELLLQRNHKLQELLQQDDILTPDELKQEVLQKVAALTENTDANWLQLQATDNRLRQFLEETLELRNAAGQKEFDRQEVLAYIGVDNPQGFQDTIEHVFQRNRDQKKLTKLSQNDLTNLKSANATNLVTIIDRLEGEDKLTAKQADLLKELGPKDATQLQTDRQNFINKLQANHPDKYHDFIRILGTQQEQEKAVNANITEFNDLSSSVTEHFNRLMNDVMARMRQHRLLQSWKRKTGIFYRKGMELEFAETVSDPSDPSGSGQRINKLKIDNINFNPTTWLESDLLTEKPTEKMEPVIQFTVSNNNTGYRQSHNMTAARFNQFVGKNNVNQAFADLKALESELDLSGKIKRGLKMQLPKANGEPTTRTVSIQNVSPSKITLDAPVQLDVGNSNLGIPARNKTELTYGEFARWYQKSWVLPEIASLAALNIELKRHTKHLNTLYKRVARNYPPIDIAGSKPLVLMYDDATQDPFVVTEATPEQIGFSNGETMTPTEFLRWVQENEVEVADPETRNNRLADESGSDGLDSSDDSGDGNNNNLFTPAAAAAGGAAAAAAAANKNPDSSPTQASESTAKRSGPSAGFLRNLWENTHVMSMMDFKKMFDEFVQFVKDKHDRRQKRTVGNVMENVYKGIPIFEPMSSRGRAMRVGADNEYVEEYKKQMEAMEVSEIFDEMYKTRDKNYFKAALDTLADKGVLRWDDDAKLMEQVNWFSKATYPEKHRNLKGQKVKVGDKGQLSESGMYLIDQYRLAIDDIWGIGTFGGLRGTNTSKYDEKKRQSAENMHMVGFEQGGIKNRIKTMLYEFIYEGVEHSAAEFDGLLENAMANNEVTMEEGMMFYIMAFSVPNKASGKTILPYAQYQPYIKAMKDNTAFIYFALDYPVLDANGNEMKDADGNTIERKKTPEDLKEIFDKFILPDLNANQAQSSNAINWLKPGPKFSSWILRDVLTHPTVKERIRVNANKSEVSNKIFHMIGPVLTNTSEIDFMIRKGGYGNRGEAHALKNVYFGYSGQLNVRARMMLENVNQDELQKRAASFTEMMQAFLYFDAGVSQRMYKHNYDYLKLDQRELDEFPPADKKSTKHPVKKYREVVGAFTYNFGEQLGNATGNLDLVRLIRRVRSATPGDKIAAEEVDECRAKLYEVVMRTIETNPQLVQQIVRANAGSLIPMA